MSTELEKFELPPLDSCHLRTHSLMLSDADIRLRPFGTHQSYEECRLREQGFIPELPYETTYAVDYGYKDQTSGVWQFRQQFLVFPNGDEYICVRRGTQREDGK